MSKKLKACPFYWIDKKGNSYKPKDMSTNHLFFSLRMIWNHGVPKHLRILPYKKYNFSPPHTEGYLKEAVPHLARELSTRRDLPPYFKENIKRMMQLKRLI